MARRAPPTDAPHKRGYHPILATRAEPDTAFIAKSARGKGQSANTSCGERRFLEVQQPNGAIAGLSFQGVQMTQTSLRIYGLPAPEAFVYGIGVGEILSLTLVPARLVAMIVKSCAGAPVRRPRPRTGFPGARRWPGWSYRPSRTPDQPDRERDRHGLLWPGEALWRLPGDAPETGD